MFKNISFGARVLAPEVLYLLRMSKNGEQVYYAVGRGREIGIYNSWSECKDQIDGVSNAKYRKFFSLEEAEEFVKFWKDYSSLCENLKDENSVSNFSKSEANFQRSREGRFDTPELFASGVESTLEKGNFVGLQPYASPITRFLNNRSCNKVRSFQKPEVKNLLKLLYGGRCSINVNASIWTDLELPRTGNSMSISSRTFTPIKSVSDFERYLPKTYCSQRGDASSEAVIKQESVQEDEEVSETRSTNYRINPQMKSEERDEDFKDRKKIEPPEVQTQESTPSQQLTATPPASSITSPPRQKSFDQKDAEVLALNLRLDSFEKRFDSCLKEVGAMASEISHIRSEIKEIKDILGQGTSGCSLVKGKDRMLQTTLNFASPSRFQSTRPDYSWRPYSTDQGVTAAEKESEECKSNRKKRRRFSRSESAEGIKRFAKDKSDDDVLSRIKADELQAASFSLDENDFVEVYTDGACHFNGEREAKAGIGIWFGDGHPLNVSEPVIGTATNNEAEIQAARIAIELAVRAGVKKLKILTDSEFLINCVTKWMHRWKRNGWTLIKGGTVKNRKELEKLDRAASQINVRWEKVLAHSGIKGNEMADRLANQGAEKYTR